MDVTTGQLAKGLERFGGVAARGCVAAIGTGWFAIELDPRPRPEIVARLTGLCSERLPYDPVPALDRDAYLDALAAADDDVHIASIETGGERFEVLFTAGPTVIACLRLERDTHRVLNRLDLAGLHQSEGAVTGPVSGHGFGRERRIG